MKTTNLSPGYCVQSGCRSLWWFVCAGGTPYLAVGSGYPLHRSGWEACGGYSGPVERHGCAYLGGKVCGVETGRLLLELRSRKVGDGESVLGRKYPLLRSLLGEGWSERGILWLWKAIRRVCRLGV